MAGFDDFRQRQQSQGFANILGGLQGFQKQDAAKAAKEETERQRAFASEEKARLTAEDRAFKQSQAEQQRAFQTEQKQLDREARMEESRLARQAKREESGSRGALAKTLSPGEKKLDQEFAKDFNQFQAQGGFADAEKGIQQLEEVSNALKSGTDTLTGPVLSLLPDAARKRFLPKSALTQQAVEEVVQRNLRLVLGAQFTEKEGVRLIERAFDPALSEEENAVKVDRLLAQMKNALEAKKVAGAHFQKFGTLRGFVGGQPSPQPNQAIAQQPQQPAQQFQPTQPFLPPAAVAGAAQQQQLTPKQQRFLELQQKASQ